MLVVDSKPFVLGVVTDQDEGGESTANNDPKVTTSTLNVVFANIFFFFFRAPSVSRTFIEV
jgi:hypothetical protein